jgi:putative ABC transport system ATP-binding protein
MELLAKIAKKDQCAILAVTHDPRTIPYADCVIEIEDGKILAQKNSGQSERVAADKTSGSENTSNSDQRKQQVHA